MNESKPKKKYYQIQTDDTNLDPCIVNITSFMQCDDMMQFNAMQCTISCQKDQNINLIIHRTFANCSFEMNKSRD